MIFKYCNDYELDFCIDVLDTLLKEYNDKVEILKHLKDGFVTELKARGRD